MKHVLVVEDDPHNAVLFRKILEKRAGCRVTVTETTDELLAIAAAGGVDLVIMDVSLPNARWKGQPVGGVELCRMLREDPRTAAIPLCLATAHAMRGDAESFVSESQADGYVSKPIMDHIGFVTQIQGMFREAA